MNIKQEALDLYQIAFPEDTAECAAQFIHRFFETNCLTRVIDGHLASMLFLFDCRILCGDVSYPAYYVYAVATHPAFRKKGLMRELMEQAKEKAVAAGRGALLIKPSNKQLFSFYEKLGFHTAFYYDEQTLSRASEPIQPLRAVTTEEYQSLRERFLMAHDHVCWDDLLDYITEDALLLAGKTFCACAQVYNGRLFVQEFLSNDGSGKDSVLAYFDQQEGVFRTSSPVMPFGMLCPLSEPLQDIQNPLYMGFAMD